MAQMEARIAAEEERMLQAALAASRGDPSNPPNPDLMSYEELLQLEDRNGRVCKGLSEEEIEALEGKEWEGREGEDEVSCSICFCAFNHGQTFKMLPACNHEYHAECIDQWLLNEKRCPVCNVEVVVEEAGAGSARSEEST